MQLFSDIVANESPKTTKRCTVGEGLADRGGQGGGRWGAEGAEGAEGGRAETSLLDFSLIHCGPLFQFFFFLLRKARPLTIIGPGLIYAACGCCL